MFGSLNKEDNGMDKKDEMSISGFNLLPTKDPRTDGICIVPV